MRIAVDGAPREVVGWFIDRGHRIVRECPAMLLAGASALTHPGPLEGTLVVAFSDTDADQRADLLLPAAPPAAALQRLERLTLCRPAPVGNGDGNRDFDLAVNTLLDTIHAAGPFLPSVYLVRGDRLRCVGARGYHQVLDGLVPGEGVAGSVIASGTPSIIANTQLHEEVLAAQAGLQAEVCLPLRHRGHVVGVLNVESSRAFTAEEVGRIHAWADALEHTLDLLDGPPPATPGQRLGYHSSRLARCTDADSVLNRLLEAAREMSTMSTGVVVHQQDSGTYRIAAAQGPLADGFRRSSQRQLQEIASWLQAASACYSHEEGKTGGWLAHEPVRAAGAGSVVVLRMAGAEASVGYLLCADPGRKRLHTDEVEQLEILAALGTSALLHVTSLDRLRHQALSDPLTGLGHRAKFAADLQALLDGPRDRSVALLLIDLDDFKQVNDQYGHQAGDRMLREVVSQISETLRDHERLYRIGGDEFAGLFDVIDHRDALAVGERVAAAARAAGLTVSVGVAVVSPDQPAPEPEVLIALADQAMYEVKAGGRDGVSLAEPPPPRAGLTS